MYPLDEKLGLIGIRNTESRYTQRFAHILTELAAEMPMDRTADMLCQICELKLGTASIPDILDSIGAIYLPETSTDSSAAISEQELPQQQNNFIGKKIEEIEANPDKDEIIKAAVEKSNHPVKDIKGSNTAEKTVFYVGCDGTGVPGIRKELEGKKGKQSDGSAKTFEAKIGVCFKQDFDGNGNPLLKNGEILLYANEFVTKKDKSNGSGNVKKEDVPLMHIQT